MKIEVNKELAKKVIKVVKPGLCGGLGQPIPGKMCVEAAVNYACGLEHDDNPPCVGSSVREFKITLNDESWSSNKARARGMIKIAIAQLGSNKINQDKFDTLIVEEFYTSVWKEFNEKLAKIKKEKSSIKEKIRKINDLSYQYNEDVPSDIENIIGGGNELFPKMKKDAFLILLADICLKVLKKMKSPGCKYLYLLNKKK